MTFEEFNEIESIKNKIDWCYNDIEQIINLLALIEKEKLHFNSITIEYNLPPHQTRIGNISINQSVLESFLIQAKLKAEKDLEYYDKQFKKFQLLKPL